MIKPVVTTKLTQFTEELNLLLSKYQYSLVPQLKTTPSGIIPLLTICDVVPPKTIPVDKKVKMLKK